MNGPYPSEIVGAIRSGDCQVVRQWLESAGPGSDDLNERFTVLHQTCRLVTHLLQNDRKNRSDRTELLKLLVAHGCDVRKTNGYGFTALHSCKSVGEAAVCINSGADPDALSDPRRLSPLMMAVTFREYHPDVVRLLLRSGADPFIEDEYGQDAEAIATSRKRFRSRDLIRDVKRAGGWKRYAKEPRIALVRLRSLCARGRATPPADPVLVRLFGAPASPTTKPAHVANRHPLPNEVVWHVLAYWRSSRDA